jgi:hypothetical protein
MPPSCHEDASEDDEEAEPCGPTKPRVNGDRQRYRDVWREFCEKQSPGDFAMNQEVADIAASLATSLIPPVARAALEELLGLSPGSLTNGSVQVVRMAVHSTEAEVIVLDPVRCQMRPAHVRLIGPSELNDVA